MRLHDQRLSGLVAVLTIAVGSASAQPMPSLWNPTGSGPAYGSTSYPQASYAQPDTYAQQGVYGQQNVYAPPGTYAQQNAYAPLAAPPPVYQDALTVMQNPVSAASYTPYGPAPAPSAVPAAMAPSQESPLTAPGNPVVAQSTYMPPPFLGYGQPTSQIVESAPAHAPGYFNGVESVGSSGFVAGADMAMLKPYLSNYQRLRIDGFDARFPHNDFEMTPRVWMGYVTATGLGVRGRYWQFDHHPDAEKVSFDDDWGLPAGDEFSMVGRLKMESIDGEIYQRVQMGSWSGNFGIGVRYGAIRHDSYLTYREWPAAAESTAVYDHLDSVGPTVLAELRRPLGGSNVSLVGNARGCLLFGEERFRRTDTLQTATAFSEERDTTMLIGEVQLGLEWSYPLSGGGRLFVQGLFEGQIWSTTGEVGGVDLELFGIGGGDLGMMGFSAGAGISR